jgi:hypothetical protein
VYPAKPACAVGVDFGDVDSRGVALDWCTVPLTLVAHPAAPTDTSAAAAMTMCKDIPIRFISCPPSGVPSL